MPARERRAGPNLNAQRMLLLSGAATLLCLALFCLKPPVLKNLDDHFYDFCLRAGQGGSPHPGIAVIDIEEASIAALGQWPWPRYILAALVQRLTDAGVAAIGLDILFSEPDRSSMSVVRADLERFLGTDIRVEGLPGELMNNDEIFAAALAESPTALSMYFRFGETTGERRPSPAPPAPGLILEERDGNGGEAALGNIPRADAVVTPLKTFMTAPLGFYNASLDSDGMLRRTFLLIRHADRVYPSLALRALMLAQGRKNLVLRCGAGGLEALKMGETVVPVSSDGAMYIPFRGPRKTYPYVRAVDVLNGSADPEALRGALVFVGASAAGLRDIRATPLDRYMPGVEMHAALCDAILSRRFLTRPHWTFPAQLLGIALWGMLSGALFLRAKAAANALLIPGLAAAPLACAWWLFTAGYVFPPVCISAAALVQGLVIPAARFLDEERQKRRLRRSFSMYVAPEIVRRIAEGGQDILSGTERELTVLFSDIRGFTAMSERLAPQELVQLLNRYFTPMTALVRQNAGTLDKFIGDALMAFWNAPFDVPDHPLAAVRTALDMQQTLADINRDLEERFGERLTIGVGVHTGPAYVGNMGSSDLLDYTAVGDTVNLASRLESLCAGYGLGIIVSGAVAARCAGGLGFQMVDVVQVKGKGVAVEAFTPISLEESSRRREELDSYDAARALYARGVFMEAAERFTTLAAQAAQEGSACSRLYEIYRERCLEFGACAPEGWDGVWTLTNK